MTPHDHRQFVPGCFRCELGRDEAMDAAQPEEAGHGARPMSDFDSLPPVRAFGTWDAPITDEAEWIDVPTDLSCIHCGERFQPGDNGGIMPMGHAEHRECGFRAVMGGIGHQVDTPATATVSWAPTRD